MTRAQQVGSGLLLVLVVGLLGCQGAAREDTLSETVGNDAPAPTDTVSSDVTNTIPQGTVPPTTTTYSMPTGTQAAAPTEPSPAASATSGTTPD